MGAHHCNIRYIFHMFQLLSYLAGNLNQANEIMDLLNLEGIECSKSGACIYNS